MLKTTFDKDESNCIYLSVCCILQLDLQKHIFSVMSNNIIMIHEA